MEDSSCTRQVCHSTNRATSLLALREPGNRRSRNSLPDRGATVLSDERLILRRHGTGLLIVTAPLGLDPEICRKRVRADHGALLYQPRTGSPSYRIAFTVQNDTALAAASLSPLLGSSRPRDHARLSGVTDNTGAVLQPGLSQAGGCRRSVARLFVPKPHGLT